MRGFIYLAEEYLAQLDEAASQIGVETEQAPSPSEDTITPAVLRDLDEVVFKLRAFMETAGGDYALGVETGMQSAADMIERVIRTYQPSGEN
jgi:hypothetical protein